MKLLMCILDTFSSTKWSFFLICATEAEFVISLLNIAAIFDFTKDLQDLIWQEWAAIFDFSLPLLPPLLSRTSHSSHVLAPLSSFHSLQVNYTQDSLTWDFMARRELDAPGAGEELQTAKGRASDINRREERCCQVYEEGVKTVQTGGWDRFGKGSLLRVSQKLIRSEWRDGFKADLCELCVFQNPCGWATWRSAWRGWRERLMCRS